jgi:hypothetical protein
VYLVLLGIAAAVVVWAIYAGNGLGAVATIVGALITLVPAMEYVGRQSDRIEVDRNRYAFLTALGCAVAGAAVFALVISSGSQDVTNSSEVIGGSEMSDGSTARLNIDAEPSGDVVKVTLAAEDEAYNSGTSCVPGSSLRFGGVDIAEESTVVMAGSEVTTTLRHRAKGPRVRVDISLDTKGNGLCGIELTLKSVNYP